MYATISQKKTQLTRTFVHGLLLGKSRQLILLAANAAPSLVQVITSMDATVMDRISLD